LLKEYNVLWPFLSLVNAQKFHGKKGI